MDDGVTAGARHVAREIVDEANDTWDDQDMYLSRIDKFSFCTEINIQNNVTGEGTILDLKRSKRAANKYGYKVTDMLAFTSGTVKVEIRPQE
jgi:hypothetical protein